MNLDDIRQFYAEEIEVVADIKTKALVTAFARVPREDFLGPGPWQIPIIDSSAASLGTPSKEPKYRSTADDNPRSLYHNVSIAIDPSRNLNNGQPASLATWLDALELEAGDYAVHIGCGVGYYTAIIAEVVGPNGRITGVEIDPDLAERSKRNLSRYLQAEVFAGDLFAQGAVPADVIFINAGATHLKPVWLESLRPGGRLVVPLTLGPQTSHGMGFMLKVRFDDGKYHANFLSPVMIFPCIGSRDEAANQRLLDAVRLGTWGSIKSVRRDPHEQSDGCWLHAEGICISTLPPES